MVCFLGYVSWKTLEQICRQAGLGDEPRRVLPELSRIRLVDVALPTRCGTEIHRRCVTQPDDHQSILLQQLGMALPSNLPLTDKNASEIQSRLRGILNTNKGLTTATGELGLTPATYSRWEKPIEYDVP